MIFSIRLANALSARLFRLLNGRSFARFGARSQIVRPIGIEQPDRISIGDDVYVAAQSCLAVQPLEDGATLTIGDGCVIAAGSVVTGDIPDGTFAGGAPARVLGPSPLRPEAR